VPRSQASRRATVRASQGGEEVEGDVASALLLRKPASVEIFIAPMEASLFSAEYYAQRSRSPVKEKELMGN